MIPDGLTWLSHCASGAAWLDRLPGLVAALCDYWGLELGPPYAGSAVSYVAAARRGGVPVVLKIQWPHRESTQEAEALRAWAGDGAVRLLDHDPVRHALLLERCTPGVALSAANGHDPIGVLIGLLPRLWRPVGTPFQTLGDEAARWRRSLAAAPRPSGPFEPRLLDAAVDLLAALPQDMAEAVLLHQDLHGENVLAAEREPWLVIDPKPLAGERAFALAPIVRSVEFGHTRAAVLHRLDRLSAELGMDRARARGWTIAQTVAWGLDSDWAAAHAETARWLLDAA